MNALQWLYFPLTSIPALNKWQPVHSHTAVCLRAAEWLDLLHFPLQAVEITPWYWPKELGSRLSTQLKNWKLYAFNGATKQRNSGNGKAKVETYYNFNAKHYAKV